MSEEIKIVVNQESRGTAISDAERQMRALKKEAEEYAKAGSPSAAAAVMKKHDAIGRDDRKVQHEIIASTSREALAERASGNSGAADALFREVEIRTVALQIQKTQNIYESEATKLATEQIAAQNQVASAKKAEADAAKAAAAAEKEQAAATKAAAGNEKKSQAAEEAAAKKAAAVAAKQEADAAKQRKAEEAEILRLKKQQQAEAEKKEHAENKAAQQQEKAAATAAKREAAEGKLVLRNALHEGAGQAGIPLGPLGNAGALGNPIALIATAIAAYVGKSFAQALERADSRAAEEGRGVESGNRRGMIGGKFGSEAESEASSLLENNKRELEEAINKRGSFRDKGLGDRFSRMLGFETSGDKASRENEQRIARLQRERPAAERLAQTKFGAGPGGDELEAQRRESRGDMVGARALRYRVEYAKEYQRILDATHSTELASEAAGTRIFNKERERRIEAASRLVNARSGAGDIARAAQFAGSTQTISRDIQRAIDGLHDTVRVNHAQALNARPSARF